MQPNADAEATAVPPETPAPSDDILSRAGRWADANPRLLYTAAAVMLTPLLLVLLGVGTSTALTLWVMGLLIAVGTKLYWQSGRSFKEDWPRLSDAWKGWASAHLAAPPSRPTEQETTEGVSYASQTPVISAPDALRCPDCAEDVAPGSVACNYCGRRFDHARMAACGTCQRRVESTVSGTCPACHSAVSV